MYGDIKKIDESTRFDFCLYQKIRQERRKTGLPVFASQQDLLDHPFLGKNVIRNGKQYFVERVFKEWSLGWYVCALIKETKTSSHACVIIENINSIFIGSKIEQVALDKGQIVKDVRFYENKPEPQFVFLCTCGENRLPVTFYGIKNCLACGKDIKDEFIAAVDAFKARFQDWKNETDKLHEEFRKEACSKIGTDLDTIISLKVSDLLKIMSELSKGSLRDEIKYFEMAYKARLDAAEKD